MDTRGILIDAGLKRFLARGYEGTGLGPLLGSVAVPKGSFYHFFASKEDFAIAVLDAYAERYREMRTALFAETSRSPLTRLMDYFAALEQEMTDDHLACGCLYGVLTQSMPTLTDPLARKLRAAFAQWEAELVEILVEAQRCGEVDAGLDAREAAAHLIDLYEGTALRARAGDVALAFRSFRTFALRALCRPAPIIEAI